MTHELFKEWQMAFIKWAEEVWAKVRHIEPEKQMSLGMTRICELELLELAMKPHAMYIEIGCGPGYSLLMANNNGLIAFGFDHLNTFKVLPEVKTNYINCEIFNGLEISQEFKDNFKALLSLRPDGTSTLVYCDNGWKVEELKYIAPLLLSGDVLATHDFPTEVPQGFSPGDDYKLMTEFEGYIAEYACLQRFWKKL